MLKDVGLRREEIEQLFRRAGLYDFDPEFR
jgi:uncharacterized protein YjiS (DUF1127 family)